MSAFYPSHKVQHATAQPKTHVRRQRRRFQRQQYLLPAAPAGSPFPPTSSGTTTRGQGGRCWTVPGLEPVAISRQWDAPEHGESWRLIHPPLNHEAAPFDRDPCQCWAWREDLAVPGVALPPRSRLSGDTGTCGDMGTHSQADPGAFFSPRYAQKVVQLLCAKPPQFCSGFLSSPPLFKKAPSNLHGPVVLL